MKLLKNRTRKIITLTPHASASSPYDFIVLLPVVFLLLIGYALLPAIPTLSPVYAQTPTPTTTPNPLVTWNEPQSLTRRVSIVQEGLRVFDLLQVGERLYAGTNSGVFVSNNDGESWTALNEGLPDAEVSSLLASKGRIFAGTEGSGIFVSDDGGTSWHASGEGLTNPRISALVGLNGRLYVGTKGGVFVSQDGGATWQAINEGLTDTAVNALLVLEDRLYVGTNDGVFVSRNQGATWQTANEGLTGSTVTSLGVIEETLFAGTLGDGVFKSEDGVTWQAVNTGLTNLLVRSLQAVGGQLFAGTDQGIFASSNQGRTWQTVDQGPQNTAVWSFLETNGNLFAGTDGGILISQDDGRTWRGNRAGLTTPVILSLLAVEQQLLAGTSSGVFISKDGGLTWQAREGEIQNSAVWTLVAVEERLLAGTNNGILISEDGGDTWRSTNKGLTDLDVRSLLAIDGGVLAGTNNGGVFISRDGGESWQAAKEGLMDSQILSLLAVEDRVLAGTGSGSIYISDDGGATWRAGYEGSLNALISSLLAVGGQLYAGTSGNGVFVSRDDGLTWNVAGQELASLSISSLTMMAGRLVAGTEGQGLFVSDDGGLTWQAANDDFTNSNVTSLLAVDDRLFVGSGGGGVFVSDDGGATWRPANGPIAMRQASDRSLPLRIQALLPSETPNEAYIATQGSGVRIFTDAGDLEKTPNLPGSGSQNVPALASVNDRPYAATFSGLFVGPNWTALPDPRLQQPIQTVTAMLPTDFSLLQIIQAGSLRPVILYAVTGDQVLLKSIDSGDSWRASATKIPGLRTTRLLIGANPGVLYAATNTGVYRSLDDGQQWAAVLPDENVRELGSAGGGIFYAATGTGLFRTTDNWQTRELAFPGDFTSVAVDPLDSQVVYAASRDNLLLSRDGGLNWQSMPQPPGMSVDQLAIGSATPNRLWAADSRLGSVVWGTVNPGFVAQVVWPRVVAVWGGWLLLLGVVTVLSLSRYSGLSLRLLLRQKLMFIPVALQYGDYRQQWERNSLVGQLLVLLIASKTGVDTNALTRMLAQLNVPIEADQLETELASACRGGLLRLQKGRYYPANAPLARTLQADEDQIGQHNLVEQIRYDHPLCANARRFLDRAGFSLVPIAEPLLYRLEFTTTSLQHLLPAQLYARFVPAETLNDRRVLAIQQQIQQFDREARVILVITDRRPTESGWAQIGTLRLGGFTVLPLDSALLNEGLATGRERTLLRTEIEQRLGTDYDPYDVRDPVAGAFSFFGREALVETLLRRLTEGRPVGVFGLRKLGKSSVLHALRDRAPFPVAAVNLQTVGRSGSLADLYQRILRYWAQEARLKAGIDWTPPSLSNGNPTGTFAEAALDLLNQLVVAQATARLGLFLDEVELIVPGTDGSGPNLDRYLTFMRAIRGIIDEDGRLSLVVASLNPAINRINAWDGEQNPTFNLFQEINLSPLATEDCIQMVRNIGLQVGLVYSDESLAAISQLSGGHPFLARQLCSVLYKQRNRQVGQIEIDEVPAGVRQFIYDDATVAHLDNGLWQEAGNASLWGQLAAKTNQAILIDLARAGAPLDQTELLKGSNVDARQTALINLERYHLIYQPQPGHYALQFGLLQAWLRRRKLGLE